jgi:hypothetical protein
MAMIFGKRGGRTKYNEDNNYLLIKKSMNKNHPYITSHDDLFLFKMII